jgi:hypothetical protein
MARVYTFRQTSSNELGWHPELGPGEGAGNYNEWFWLDGQFDEGYHYSLGLFGGARKSISLNIMSPDGTMHRGEQQFPDDAFKAEPFGAAWGDNKVLGKLAPDGQPESFELRLAAGDVAVDMFCKAVVVPGVKFTEDEPGYSYYNPLRKMALGWWPLVPKADADGALTVGGKRVKVKGGVYLERQLASMPLGGGAGQKTGQAVWCWGHFYAGDYTAVWTDSAASEHYRYRHFTPFVLWKGNQVILSTFQFAGYVEKFGADNETGIPYPVVESLKASDGITELTAQFLPGKIIDHRGWYCRQYSDVDVQVRRWGETESLRGASTHEWGAGAGWLPWPQPAQATPS